MNPTSDAWHRIDFRCGGDERKPWGLSTALAIAALVLMGGCVAPPAASPSMLHSNAETDGDDRADPPATADPSSLALFVDTPETGADHANARAILPYSFQNLNGTEAWRIFSIHIPADIANPRVAIAGEMRARWGSHELGPSGPQHPWDSDFAAFMIFLVKHDENGFEVLSTMLGLVTEQEWRSYHVNIRAAGQITEKSGPHFTGPGHGGGNDRVSIGYNLSQWIEQQTETTFHFVVANPADVWRSLVLNITGPSAATVTTGNGTMAQLRFLDLEDFEGTTGQVSTFRPVPAASGLDTLGVSTAIDARLSVEVVDRAFYWFVPTSATIAGAAEAMFGYSDPHGHELVSVSTTAATRNLVGANATLQARFGTGGPGEWEFRLAQQGCAQSVVSNICDAFVVVLDAPFPGSAD